jgi:hypothetical protein
LKIYIKDWGKENFFHEFSHSNLLLFSLSKSIPNASSPRLRTGIVKFDYDASDPNELSVLAKEV